VGTLRFSGCTLSESFRCHRYHYAGWDNAGGRRQGGMGWDSR
jgi:hypothetical protein